MPPSPRDRLETLATAVSAALEFMAAHPQIAGVGGQVLEQNTQSLEYIARVERGSAHMRAGAVDRLDMGGLYRRQAIEHSGHFSNRNLHSYEEFDLAVRLRSLGWGFWRLALPSVRHTGHDAPVLQLLARRWRSRYICGPGELLRAALGTPHLPLVLRDLRELRLYLAVLLWWLTLASVAFWPLGAPARGLAFAGLLLFPLLVMSWRKRSLTKAGFSVLSWCVNTAGLLRGLLQPQKHAHSAIASMTVREPASQ